VKTSVLLLAICSYDNVTKKQYFMYLTSVSCDQSYEVDGNRLFIQVCPTSAFVNTYEYVASVYYSSQYRVNFSKGMLD
jgi:hypothetical protein